MPPLAGLLIDGRCTVGAALRGRAWRLDGSLVSRSWPGAQSSRRRDCHFTDISSPSMLKHLLKVEGGCSRMTVSPHCRPIYHLHNTKTPTSSLFCGRSCIYTYIIYTYTNVSRSFSAAGQCVLGRARNPVRFRILQTAPGRRRRGESTCLARAAHTPPPFTVLRQCAFLPFDR